MKVGACGGARGGVERVPTLVLEDASGEAVTIDPREAAAGGRLYLAFWASYCRTIGSAPRPVAVPRRCG